MRDAFEPISVLGMMSGTSMDGVDAAVLVTDGENHLEFGDTGFRAYATTERDVLRAGQGMWPGEDLEAASEVVHRAHVELSEQFPSRVIGFHGQTLAHDPDHARTHQLGDGSVLAKATGRDVVWDFRSEDMRAGGQGAPLAPFFHFAIARHIGATEPVGVINLGGVANVTFVDPRKASPEEPGALLAFDTGPASALVDDFMTTRLGTPFDENGKLAATGQVDTSVLARLGEVDFLSKLPPKSLDRNDFAEFAAAVSGLSDEDGAATLTALTAECLGRATLHLPKRPTRWLVAGGGRKNKTMMRMISDRLGCHVAPVEDVGLNGDFIEAQAFAWLAVRVMRGLPTTAPGTTGCRRPLSGGKISRP